MVPLAKKIRGAVCYTVLFIFLSHSTTAQEARFGLKGGFNYSSIVGDLTQGLKFRLSGHGGLFLEIDFFERFKLRPELLYSSQGFQYSTDLAAIESGGTVAGGNDFRTNVQLNFITLPILGKFSLNDQVAVEFGPQFGFLLNQVIKQKDVDRTPVDTDRRTSVSGDFQLDYGAAIGLGVRLGQKMSLSPRFYVGLRNRLNALQGAQNYNVALQLSLHYLVH